MNCFSFFFFPYSVVQWQPHRLTRLSRDLLSFAFKKKITPLFFSLVLVFCQRLSPLLLFTSGSVTAFSLRVASKRNEKGCPPLLTHVFLSHYEADSINVKFHCQFVLPVSGCMTVAVSLYTRGNERLDSENSQAQRNTICVCSKHRQQIQPRRKMNFLIFCIFFCIFVIFFSLPTRKQSQSIDPGNIQCHLL